jgi:hypothetical protein
MFNSTRISERRNGVSRSNASRLCCKVEARSGLTRPESTRLSRSQHRSRLGRRRLHRRHRLDHYRGKRATGSRSCAPFWQEITASRAAHWGQGWSRSRRSASGQAADFRTWRNTGRAGPIENCGQPGARNGSFRQLCLESCRSAFVKSFGRLQASESPRRTNPRECGCELWGFADRAQVAPAGKTVGGSLGAVIRKVSQGRPMVREGPWRC